jgi:CheY-like chemotaxis protein
MTVAVRERILSLDSEKHEAEHMNYSKSELLAHIGHELRTPLHGIIELADVMLEVSPSPEQRSCAKNIVRSATSLLSLAHNMVDINTLEQRGSAPELISYDLRTVVEEVAEILSLRSAHKGVELIAYYDPDCPRYFLGQAARLHQIFANMIEHSLRMTDEAQILISVHGRAISQQEARVWILVEDAGIGLERSQVEAIWKSGEGEAGGLYEYQDVGLDLLVSKQIAGLIGGSMGRIGGKAGGGETTWFAITQLIDAEREAEAKETSCNLGGAKTLIAVNNPLTAKLLSKILTDWQAQCTIASKGSEAFEALEDSVETNLPFDYLITCESFADDGSVFIQKIAEHAEFGKLRTVYMSSLTSLFDASTIGDRLPVNMLTAPFALDALRRAVEDF